MATRFTLIVENKPDLFNEACAMVAEDINSFTVTRGAVGYWYGQREASFKIEVVMFTHIRLHEMRLRMRVVAAKLKALLKQDAILFIEESLMGAELI